MDARAPIALLAALAIGAPACASIEGLSGEGNGSRGGGGGATVIQGSPGSGGDPGGTIQDPPSDPGPGDTSDDGGASLPSSDAGCARGATRAMSLGPPVTVGPSLGGDAGAPFDEACPAGGAIVGFDLVADPAMPNGLFQIRAECAAITVDPCDGAVAFAAPKPLAYQGTDRGDDSKLACPAGHVVVGVTVTASKYVHAMSIACAPLLAAPSSEGVAWSLGPRTVVGPAGGSGDFPLLAFDCPAGAVAGALDGTFGDNPHDYVDAIAIGCGVPALASPARSTR